MRIFNCCTQHSQIWCTAIPSVYSPWIIDRLCIFLVHCFTKQFLNLLKRFTSTLITESSFFWFFVFIIPSWTEIHILQGWRPGHHRSPSLSVYIAPVRIFFIAVKMFSCYTRFILIVTDVIIIRFGHFLLNHELTSLIYQIAAHIIVVYSPLLFLGLTSSFSR